MIKLFFDNTLYSPFEMYNQQFAPSPYMQQGMPMPMPMPVVKPSTPGWVIGLGILAIVVIVAYVFKLGPFAPDVVDASLGGVAPPDTPAGKVGAPTTPTSVQIATTPDLNAKKVASIVFTKNSGSMTKPDYENDDWRTFQIGEVKVYDSTGKVLSAGDFTSASYNTESNGYASAFAATNAVDGDPSTFTHTAGASAIHQMTLVLKAPTDVSHVQVLNREDCCQARLAGTVCELKNTSGAVIKSFPLTVDQVQNLVVA